MTTRKSVRWVKWLLLLAVAGGAVAGWQWYARRPKAEAMDFKTAALARGDLTQTVTANGQIVATWRVEARGKTR